MSDPFKDEQSDYYAAEPDRQEPELRDTLRRVWGYKWLIVSIIVLGVGITWLVVQQITPRYTATSILFIEPPERNITDFKQVVEGLDTNQDTIRGEEVVLQSRELAEKTLERLHLFENGRLDARTRDRSFFSHLNPFSYLPDEWQARASEIWTDPENAIFGYPDGETVSLEIPLYEDLEKARRSLLVKRFLDRLQVRRDQLTRVIRISFTSEDPTLARDAANALADSYVASTLDVKYAGTREAAEWLNSELKDLKAKVDASEAAAEQLRQGEALVEGRGSELVANQISALNQQLLTARVEAARKRAFAQQIKGMRGRPNGEEDGSALFESPMIQTLRVERFKLESELAQLSVDYGPRHPTVIRVREEIANIQQKISREIDKIIDTAQNEVALAEQQEALITQSLDKLTGNVGERSGVEVQLRALDREAAANRSLYEKLLTRSKETDVQEKLQQPDARVVSYAQIPDEPSYPPKQRFVLISFVLSTGLALGLVYLLERLDKGFRTGRQVEKFIGLPVLGLIPETKLRKVGVKSPEDLIIEDDPTRFTEAINLIYSRLRWPGDGAKQKAILVSSALPKEGKTSTAIALARRAALLGDKVLLVDADFRRPTATRQLGMKRTPGLAEVWAGEITLADALQRDESSGAYFLSSGKLKEDPIALLGADKFRDLIRKLVDGIFDLIIVDSSPILAVAEPQIISRAVGQTLILIRWGKTPREAAHAAVKQIQDYGANVAGLALTQVNLKKQSYFGYGEYGYYTSRMKGYYADG